MTTMMIGMIASIVGMFGLKFQKGLILFSIVWLIGFILILAGIIDMVFFDNHYKPSKFI
jgi:hypothetical protein